MNTHELAAWIQNEHQIVGDLSASLLEKVASVPRANKTKWVDEVRTAFEHLRAHMTKHMALEEQGGYMTVVTEVRPTLSPEVARLGHEHREFGHLMNHIHRMLLDVGPEDNLLIRDICHRVNDLISYIDHHNRTENVLVMSALSQDIGAKD